MMSTLPPVKRQLSVLILSMLLHSLTACSAYFPQRANNFQSAPVDVYDTAHRARQAYLQGRLQDAIFLYEQVVERVPHDADAWFRLANTHVQQGSFQLAIQAYEISLTHSPDQPKAWFNLSTAYLLNAQASMLESQARLSLGDPAVAMIDTRLQRIESLLSERLE